jgi:ribosomal protein L34E
MATNSPHTSDSQIVHASPRTGLEAVDEMLAAQFDMTHHDVRGGVAIDYLTGEQVISRLLAVLGTCGWSFRILQHDIHLEADEVWVLGELRLLLNADDPVVRQQFGSSKIKRARATGAPLDIGFDLKSAATDCLKKCATLVGIGLYLTHKEEERPGPSAGTQPNGAKQREQRQTPATRRHASTSERSSESQPVLACERCGQQLQTTPTRDGGEWTPAELANYTRREHNQTLCAECARTAHGVTAQSRATSHNAAE